MTHEERMEKIKNHFDNISLEKFEKNIIKAGYYKKISTPFKLKNPLSKNKGENCYE